MIDLTPLDRHARIALCFSGGKDSLACVYLLRDQLHRLTIYHLDTGDLLPEMQEIVAHVESFAPHFVRVRTDVAGWIETHGMPTDLFPHSAHPVGVLMGETAVRLVPRYDCCYANLMLPLFLRIREDGCTLSIRGTKTVDMRSVPASDGQTADGVEVMLPLQGWSHDDVFAYLRSVGAPIARVYQHVTNSPECARCSAWWGEKRAEYLKQYHPALFAEYAARLRIVSREIAAPLAALGHEMAVLNESV